MKNEAQPIPSGGERHALEAELSTDPEAFIRKYGKLGPSPLAFAKDISTKELLMFDAVLVAREKLKSYITQAIEESPCSFEDAIDILKQQIAWLAKERQNEHGDSDKPAYHCEPSEGNGCEKCGHGALWDIVGPDGYALGTSYGDKELVDDLVEHLNDAYEMGREAE